MHIYKYQGAGNDFLVIDARENNLQLKEEDIVRLCDRRYGIGADGFMVLKSSDRADFAMEFYNSDGSSGMMCGNGGRCIVAFAHRCGYRSYRFMAPDGMHTGQVLSCNGDTTQVRLQMIDVDRIERLDEGAYFLNTGTVHYVTFRKEIAAIDVSSEGRAIRQDNRFAPIGTNVNFVERTDEGFRIRTFEKGVEDETYACGTGIVASSLANCYELCLKSGKFPDGRVQYQVQALRDRLKVDFLAETGDSGNMIFKDIYLTGPASFVFETEIEL